MVLSDGEALEEEIKSKSRLRILSLLRAEHTESSRGRRHGRDEFGKETWVIS